MESVSAAETSSVRPYRGIDPADRLAARCNQLLMTGLDLLGADRSDAAELTVRGICREAGLAIRYFYESFADKDEFISAVFDWVVTDLATSTQAVVDAAAPANQTRAGMAKIVETIAGDVRVGRLLFSTRLANAVLLRKRAESNALFAMLSGQHAEKVLRVPENGRIKAAAHFVVGGVGQTLSAWLAGTVELDADQLTDQLASLLDELADPALYHQ